MLKDENVAIDYASNAIEAMLMVSQNNYDIILMDIVMPELSGTDAMLKIKKHNADKQTKLLPTLQILKQIVMLSMLSLGLTTCLKNQ
ncbi:response regulator [Pseudoalteromonas sp. Hal099]